MLYNDPSALFVRVNSFHSGRWNKSFSLSWETNSFYLSVSKVLQLQNVQYDTYNSDYKHEVKKYGFLHRAGNVTFHNLGAWIPNAFVKFWDRPLVQVILEKGTTFQNSFDIIKRMAKNQD